MLLTMHAAHMVDGNGARDPQSRNAFYPTLAGPGAKYR